MVSTLFGIEKELFNQVSLKERNSYRFSAFIFILIVIISFFSGTYLSYMIFKLLYANILIGLVIAFIIFNLLRFSLSSIEKSQDSKDNRVNYSSYLFKFFIFSLLAMFIGFPIASLVQRNDSTQLIKNEKSRILKQYKNNLDLAKINKVKYLENRISTIKNELNLNPSSKNLEEKLLFTENEKESLSFYYDTLNKKRIEYFENNLNNSELLLFQISNISTNDFGLQVISFVLFLFYYLLIKIKNLVYSESSVYYAKAYNHYSDIIKTNSIEYSKLTVKILQEKYNYVSQSENQTLVQNGK